MSVATIVKVGPHGYEHGWIFVGAPGVGTHVVHPVHGHGTVSHVGDSRIGVKFDNGHAAEFGHVKKPGPGTFEKRPADPAHDAAVARYRANNDRKIKDLTAERDASTIPAVRDMKQQQIDRLNHRSNHADEVIANREAKVKPAGGMTEAEHDAEAARHRQAADEIGQRLAALPPGGSRRRGVQRSSETERLRAEGRQHHRRAAEHQYAADQMRAARRPAAVDVREPAPVASVPHTEAPTAPMMSPEQHDAEAAQYRTQLASIEQQIHDVPRGSSRYRTLVSEGRRLHQVIGQHEEAAHRLRQSAPRTYTANGASLSPGYVRGGTPNDQDVAHLVAAYRQMHGRDPSPKQMAQLTRTRRTKSGRPDTTKAPVGEEMVAYLLKAAESPNVLYAEQAEAALAKMFDPSEPRGPGGTWISGGGGSGGKKPPKKEPSSSGMPPAVAAKPAGPSPTVSASAQSSSGGGESKKPKGGGSKAGRAETAKIEAKLSVLPKVAEPTPMDRAAAVTAMQSKYGIPSGKALSSLQPDRKAGASQMASATRTLTGLTARRSAAQAEVNAIAELAKKAKSAQAKKLLASRMASAQKKLSGVQSAVKTANAEFAQGLSAWQG